ncbi:Peptidase S9A/B/C family catalytic domain protein [Operophtera brumata]|uniref:Peptidase S9A/B/C family catalytic domain protein n=1 Tax=Operophtera brumata TaxID=104452 RepID=A0A0L7K310_OPEBR|nr:Peptidase S9A/B/C family catalytic domain protein [Operophtera brumata]
MQDSFQRNMNRFAVHVPMPIANEPISGPVFAPTDSDAECPSGMKVSVSCDRGITAELAKLKYDGNSCV